MKFPGRLGFAEKDWYEQLSSIFPVVIKVVSEKDFDYSEQVLVMTSGQLEQFLSNWEFAVWDAARSGQYDGLDDFERSDIYKEYRTNFPPKKES
jgi:hypothetical protein